MDFPIICLKNAFKKAQPSLHLSKRHNLVSNFIHQIPMKYHGQKTITKCFYIFPSYTPQNTMNKTQPIPNYISQILYQF